MAKGRSWPTLLDLCRQGITPHVITEWWRDGCFCFMWTQWHRKEKVIKGGWNWECQWEDSRSSWNKVAVLTTLHFNLFMIQVYTLLQASQNVSVCCHWVMRKPRPCRYSAYVSCNTVPTCMQIISSDLKQTKNWNVYKQRPILYLLNDYTTLNLMNTFWDFQKQFWLNDCICQHWCWSCPENELYCKHGTE